MLWGHVMFYDVILCHIMSHHIILCHVMSHHITSYHIISHHVTSYHIISHHHHHHITSGDYEDPLCGGSVIYSGVFQYTWIGVSDRIWQLCACDVSYAGKLVYIHTYTCMHTHTHIHTLTHTSIHTNKQSMCVVVHQFVHRILDKVTCVRVWLGCVRVWLVCVRVSMVWVRVWLGCVWLAPICPMC